jgi:hypothetical protein
MNGRPNYLFCDGDSFALRDGRRRQMEAAIDGIDGNRLLNSSVEDLVAYFAEQFCLKTPVLHRDEATVSQREGQVELYDEFRQRPFSTIGTILELTVPFDGQMELFKVRPSTSSSMLPSADVGNGALVIRVKGRNLSPELVKSEFGQQLNMIQEYLSWLRGDLDPFSVSLAGHARTRIEQRRAKLLGDQNLVAGLGFKLKDRPDAPKTFTAPVSRKRLHPTMPAAATAPFKPEPVLADAEYKSILDVMGKMALVMERSPSAFQTMDEESLRVHFLVQLNAQYEGQATGETFNYQGKTDILIRADGRNIFIAECKYWKGAKAYSDTIDQILSYLSWRDTKAAIVVFNRNKAFTNVLAEIQKATKTHSRYKSGPIVESETRFRYVFGQKADPSREIVLTVMAFDVPNPT